MRNQHLDPDQQFDLSDDCLTAALDWATDLPEEDERLDADLLHELATNYVLASSDDEELICRHALIEAFKSSRWAYSEAFHQWREDEADELRYRQAELLGYAS